MMQAHCGCGRLSLILPDRPERVVACHCVACQRRTGSPFGVGAFYPADSVAVSGESAEFTRPGASGGMVRNRFCPGCGATVFWTADRLPGFIGVAVGMLAEPGFPAPDWSIHESSMHRWVCMDGAAHHAAQGAPSGSRP